MWPGGQLAVQRKKAASLLAAVSAPKCTDSARINFKQVCGERGRGHGHRQLCNQVEPAAP